MRASEGAIKILNLLKAAEEMHNSPDFILQCQQEIIRCFAAIKNAGLYKQVINNISDALMIQIGTSKKFPDINDPLTSNFFKHAHTVLQEDHYKDISSTLKIDIEEQLFNTDGSGYYFDSLEEAERVIEGNHAGLLKDAVKSRMKLEAVLWGFFEVLKKSNHDAGQFLSTDAVKFLATIEDFDRESFITRARLILEHRDQIIAINRPIEGFSAEKIQKELLYILFFPESIDQKDSYLCGVDVFLRCLVNDMPQRLIQFVLDLSQNDKSQLSSHTFFLKHERFPRATSFISLLMQTIKANTTKTRYSEKNPLLVKSLQELTRPKLLCSLLELSGYQNVRDGTIVSLFKGFEMPKVIRGVLGGVYHQSHIIINKDLPHLKEIVGKVKSGSTVIMLLDGPFITTGKHDDALLTTQNIHYIKIDNADLITTIESSIPKIRIEFNTYGRSYVIEKDLYSFFKAYKGEIIASPPNKTNYRLSTTAPSV